MKEIKILIGDYEYAKIEEIFKKEEDFKPTTETDQIIIKALGAIISRKNLVQEDVGGAETEDFSIKKISEPKNKEIDSTTRIKT
jgi:hypothetical protein